MPRCLPTNEKYVVFLGKMKHMAEQLTENGIQLGDSGKTALKVWMSITMRDTQDGGCRDLRRVFGEKIDYRIRKFKKPHRLCRNHVFLSN